MTLEAIRYRSRGHLEILDQLLLPLETRYERIRNVEDGWHAIKDMKVRGAPAIAITGALSLVAEMVDKEFDSLDSLLRFLQEKLDYLLTARPTAVNLKRAADDIVALAKNLSEGKNAVDDSKDRIISLIEDMLTADLDTNKRLGQHGADHVLKHSSGQPQTVITHCNAGSLATSGYGTALGVVRALAEREKLQHVYCTETRPYNQGSRLTAYELVYDKLPGSLIADSMASYAMKEKKITAVFVGADRVVANGDTANKIGTYQLAIAAKHHGIPFYVCAPTTTVDLNLASGEQIVIEERPHKELTCLKDVQLAAPGIGCWNPAFDVTPASLITGGIVTENGVFPPDKLQDSMTADHNTKHNLKRKLANDV
ncbi:methylthioribose-1-phosphate isomerase-like [Apostichopus japonicus]|uniref:methylthioribose-1-phosphate isomerase-like n=1 Tax=Stichopus japonicus TaxID=307972 RepID=UPI003AB46DAF